MRRFLLTSVCLQLTKGLLMGRNTFFVVYAALKLLKRAKNNSSACRSCRECGFLFLKQQPFTLLPLPRFLSSPSLFHVKRSRPPQEPHLNLYNKLTQINLLTVNGKLNIQLHHPKISYYWKHKGFLKLISKRNSCQR